MIQKNLFMFSKETLAEKVIKIEDINEEQYIINGEKIMFKLEKINNNK